MIRRFLHVAIVAIGAILLRSSVLYATEFPPPQSPWTYHLGQGLRLGHSGITIGGYGSIRYEEPRNAPREFAASALSMFLTWDSGAHIHLFSELELEDFVVVREGREFGSRSNPFEVERLYADVYLTDAINFRLGKFLTPIGRWNLLHADPLVWTTSRPLVTSQAFSPNITGGMFYGTVTPLGKALDYSFYVEATDEIDPDDRESPFKEAVGFHLLYHPSETTTVGASYANFAREESRESHEDLFGVDLFWSRQRYELTGEFVYRRSEKGSAGDDEWGLFAQGVIPLTTRFFAVGRYEYFDVKGPQSGVHLWLVALAFRPVPPLILKAEYTVGQNNHGNIPEGFATSLALLF